MRGASAPRTARSLPRTMSQRTGSTSGVLFALESSAPGQANHKTGRRMSENESCGRSNFHSARAVAAVARLFVAQCGSAFGVIRRLRPSTSRPIDLMTSFC